MACKREEGVQQREQQQMTSDKQPRTNDIQIAYLHKSTSVKQTNNNRVVLVHALCHTRRFPLGTKEAEAKPSPPH